jgi:hypothetical protein
MIEMSIRALPVFTLLERAAAGQTQKRGQNRDD